MNLHPRASRRFRRCQSPRLLRWLLPTATAGCGRRPTTARRPGQCAQYLIRLVCFPFRVPAPNAPAPSYPRSGKKNLKNLIGPAALVDHFGRFCVAFSLDTIVNNLISPSSVAVSDGTVRLLMYSIGLTEKEKVHTVPNNLSCPSLHLAPKQRHIWLSFSVVI
jgi:hypothetical protein